MKKSKIELKCKTHPKYKGNSAPRTTKCVACWKIYAAKLEIKIEELETDLAQIKGE